MKKALLLILLFSYSCSTSNIVVEPNNSTTQNTSKQQTTFVEKEIAGLKFNKVSDQNAALINNSNQQNNKNNAVNSSASSLGQVPPQSPTADLAIRQGITGATGTEISKSAKPNVYGGYLNTQNPFEEYIMTDYEEAKTNGFKGTFIEAYNSQVKPILKEWATDAKATYVYGNAGQDGKGDENINNMYSPYQWQYTYASPSKKEVYSILISSKETLVLRQKWTLKDFVDLNIKIDSAKAISIFSDKVKDKNYNAEYDNNNLGPNSQPLYEIPANSYWTFYLSQEKNSLVWNINTNYTYPTMPPISNNKSYVNTWYSGGFAKINAETGDVISMSRPVKYTETVQSSIEPECNEQGCVSPGYVGITSD